MTVQQAARAAVAKALKNGVLTRPRTCEHCGRTCRIGDPVGHHHKGYEPEHVLDVVWLCTSCHSKEHARLRREAKVAAS